MITSSPEDYGYTQIDRPVIAGGSEFLARAALVGKQILGTEIITSVTEFGITEVIEGDKLGEPEYQVKGVSGNVMHIGEQNDLRMVLLHRGTPPEISSRFKHAYHAGLLAARRRIVRGRINPDEPDRGKHMVPTLTEQLDQISLDHDKKPHNMHIKCDRIVVLDEPGGDLVLGLLPVDDQIGTLILHRQAKLAHERLASQSKRLAYPVSPGTISIPFARIPGEISDVNYTRLMKGLNSHLPHAFVLGGINITSKVPSPTD
jgi:hypothetical protein